MKRGQAWLLAAVIVFGVWLGISGCSALARRIGRLPVTWPEMTGTVRSDVSTDVAVEDATLLQVDIRSGNVKVVPAPPDERVVTVLALVQAFSKSAHDALLPQVTRGAGRIRVSTPTSLLALLPGPVSASYEISAPPYLELRVSVTNGQVTVTGWQAPVGVSSVNGALRLQVPEAPRVAGRTTNGSIAAHLGGLVPGEHSLSTTNGSISLTLEAGVALAVDARTVSGKVALAGTGWTVEESGAAALRASRGEAEARLTLRAVNGSITVKAD
jgi:hypothetical protein